MIYSLAESGLGVSPSSWRWGLSLEIVSLCKTRKPVLNIAVSSLSNSLRMRVGKYLLSNSVFKLRVADLDDAFAIVLIQKLYAGNFPTILSHT
jgi:hypothetical protein